MGNGDEPEEYYLNHKFSWISEEQLLPLNIVKIASIEKSTTVRKKSSQSSGIPSGRKECDVCGNQYMNRSSLLLHLKSKHGIENLKCAFCPKVFPDKEKLKAHREEHRRKECHVCGKICQGNSSLLKHLRFHSNEKPVQCQICDKRFREKKCLDYHMRAAHPSGKMFYCRYCKRDFPTKQAYMADKVKHRQRTCAVCGKTFRAYNELKGHEAMHSEQRPFKCGMCNQHFKTKKGLKAHMKQHTSTKEFTCDICSKSFHEKSELRSHQVTHSNLKPFQCQTCSAAFKLKSSLVSHQRVHSGAKPFQCSICHVYFSQSSKLKSHQRVHSDDKPFVCSVCGEHFRGRAQWKDHEQLHVNSEAFKCSTCSMIFTCRSNLKRHQMIHLKKNFQCSLCDKKFHRYSALMNHGRIHNENEWFSCDKCSKKYSYKSALVKHLKENH